jgi:hypothetical protein
MIPQENCHAFYKEGMAVTQLIWREADRLLA